MIRSILRKLRRIAWFLPGFLLWASFPPMGEVTDVLFALAPLMWLSRRSEARTSAWRWAQSGFLFWFATLSWMPAIVKNGGPWPLVVLGWAGLAAYCTLYFAAYGWLTARYWRWARGLESFGAAPSQKILYARRILGILIVEPVLWAGFELIRSRFLGGFAWNQLGVVAVNAGFGAPAAVGGVYLLSAAVILVNGSIAGIAERFWRPEESGLAGLRRYGSVETFMAFALVFAIYALPTRWGGGKVEVEGGSGEGGVGVGGEKGDVSGGERAVKVALVQRNFPCVFQRREESPVEAYGKLLANVSPLSPDLVVLSESAFGEIGAVGTASALRFANWICEQSGARAVLAGANREEDGRLYNSAALYDGGDAPQIYDKVHLVPFGEYIPLDDLIPALKRLAPVGSCTAGALKTLSLRGASANEPPVRLGVAICFEDTDSAQIRRLAADGAEVLAFITNDSWFSHSVESWQHAWQARARAIETGLPVVRTGNSGVSGTIRPDGTATWLVDAAGRPLVDRRGTMFDRVRTGGGARTVYTVLGDAPLACLFALLIGGGFLIQYAKHHERRRTLSL